MPLRGATLAKTAAEVDINQFWDISSVTGSILGNSTGKEKLTTLPASYGAWQFPEIPDGAETTIIPVPFPVTRSPEVTKKELKASLIEEGELATIFVLAMLLWMLPSLCINKKLCCQCFRRWISRRLSWYFFLGLIFNIGMLCYVIAREEHIHANDVFFAIVKLIGIITDIVDSILTKLAIMIGVFVAWYLRKRIFALLGFDYQIIKTDLRDILTGFSMKRFTPIEISLLKACNLAPGMVSRTLFVRITSGYNEPCHSRPHSGVQSDFKIQETIQLNYDEQDESQKMTISIKQQEAAGAAVTSFLPAAGAGLGAIAGMTQPIGPGPGMAMGLVTGVGAANSMQKEVARVDLSSSMVNRLLDQSRQQNSARRGNSVRPTVPWNEATFIPVDLVPEGTLWLRICDVDE